MKYRAEIDGLRAIAVVVVIFFHAGFPIFSGGYVGVDVFFVISGFLITSIISDELTEGTFSFRLFYERRIRRLLPALFLVMALCLPIAVIMMPPAQYLEFSRSMVAVSLFVSNILFWQESGYFGAAANEKPLLHTWSLAVEEQFYAFFPLLLLLLWRFGLRNVQLVLAVLAVISFAMCVWASTVMQTANFYLFPTRVWELLLGAMSAHLLRITPLPNFRWPADLGLVAIVVSVFVFDEQTRFPSEYTLIPTVGTVLILLFAREASFSKPILQSKHLVGIGLISYSAYLWHQPLFAFSHFFFPEGSSWAIVSALTFATFGFAYLSWKYVERPFRNMSSPKRLPQRVIFVLAISVSLIFILIGASGIQNQGYKGRFEQVLIGDVNHDEFYAYLDKTYLDCDSQRLADRALSNEGYDRCRQTLPGPPEWVLLGDSHAEHLFIGLAEANPKKNIATYIGGKEPYFHSKRYAPIYAEILASERKLTIVLAMYFAGYSFTPEVLETEYGNIVDQLQRAGHSVLLVSDTPYFDIHPQKCLFAKNTTSAETYCSAPKSYAEQQLSQYDETLETLSQKYAVPYLMLTDAICSEWTCSMIDGNKMLYRDEHHLNILGSRLVGRHLSALMQPFVNEDQINTMTASAK